jgi:hypothetical protein
MLIWLPWGSESATVIATITNVRNSVTENDVLSPNDFDYMTTIVNYTYNGSADLEIGGIIETTCEATMLYYPADRQVCSLQIYVQSEGLRFVEKSEYNKANKKYR